MVITDLTRTGVVLGLVSAVFGVVLVFSIFGSGVGGGYILDDLTSVAPMTQLRSSPELFWQLVASDKSGALGRPLTMITFALEQTLFAAKPSLSQFISIGFHIANGILVFVLLAAVLGLNGFKQSLLIAFLAALLWSCAPQKVSTALYIVQRMAILSTLLVLISLVAYVFGRCATRTGSRFLWFAVCFISIVAAPFAKENGVLAIPLIAAVELFAIPYHSSLKSHAPWKLAARFILAIGGLCFCAYGLVEYSRSDITYAQRNFDFGDRLGGAPAILGDYILQFFVPSTSRMGLIQDDFPVSSILGLSAGAVVSTLFWLSSLIFILACAVQKKASLVAAALLFFLIGHCIESFYLPLELYFEHRNYLPSVGLALLFAALLIKVVDLNHGTHSRPVFVLTAVYIASLSFSSYALAAHWRSGESLLLHDLQGHPYSSRVIADSALAEAARGDLGAAHPLIDNADELSQQLPAARPMGKVDPVLLSIAAHCLSGQSPPLSLPSAPQVRELDSVRSASVRFLRELYAGGACPELDWEEVSDWLYQLTAASVDMERELRIAALVDLYDFEVALGNPLRAFVYASIAYERDEGATVLLRLAEASVALGDQTSIDKTFLALTKMSNDGELSGYEELLFARLTHP
ncbi:MAG: hypothetical protein NWQ45_09860 [Congregibacter sp.]|nr:hypothetical protein [Congregibacter sp.]